MKLNEAQVKSDEVTVEFDPVKSNRVIVQSNGVKLMPGEVLVLYIECLGLCETDRQTHRQTGMVGSRDA